MQITENTAITTQSIERFIALCSLALLAAFLANGISYGYYGMLPSQLLLGIALLSYLGATFGGGTGDRHVVTALVALATVIGSAMYYFGIHGAFWGFPAVLTCSLIGAKRAGIFLSVCFCLIIPLACWRLGIELEIITRLIATLTLTALISHYASTKRSELQKQLQKASTTDPLTGLYNRRSLYQLVEQRLEDTATLILIDIDHFKDINDTFGHDVGDQVLVKVSSVITEVIGPKCQAFRVGGEEFLVIAQPADAELGNQLAENIRKRVEATPILGDHPVTISLGQTAKGSDETFDQALKRVDSYLYESKNQGRNRITRS